MLGKRSLAIALLLGFLYSLTLGSASRADSHCILESTPTFNRISYEAIDASRFKVVISIYACKGTHQGFIRINDQNGIQVIEKNKADWSISEGYSSGVRPETRYEYQISGLKTGYYSISLFAFREQETYRNLPDKIYATFFYDRINGYISEARFPPTTSPPTTTIAPTTTPPPTTTTAPKLISMINDNLNLNSIELKNGNMRIPVLWTVQINDPAGRRLSGSTVGAQLCPASSVWPLSTGCIGAASSGLGNSFSRTYRFRFLFSSTAPLGQWIPRMTSPISDMPELVGQSRLSVSNSQSSTTLVQQPNVAVITIINESFSATSLRGNNPWIKYSVKISCEDTCTKLPATIEGRLCATGQSFENATCTGAVMQSSGKGNQRTYVGLFRYRGSPDPLLRSTYLKATVNSEVKLINGSRTIPWVP